MGLKLKDSYIAVLSSKGQIVIPKDIRVALRSREGDQFEVVIEGCQVVLRSTSKHFPNWRWLRGAYGPVDQTTAVAEGRKEEFEKERRRLRPPV